MRDVKISVILPCYNVEKLIDRCLTSIVKQTIGLDSIEVICVDDCSKDNTLSVLYEWEKKYPDNFIIVESGMNGRQGQARNIGLQYANAEWIAFIDSDDWIDNTYLEDLYKYTDSNREIICCGYKRDFSKKLTSFEDENPNVRFIDINTDEDRKLQIMNPDLEFCAWAKLISKSFLIDNDLLFPTNITYEDAAWGSLVHLYYEHACILEKKLYHYFVNEKSTVLTENSNHHLDCLTAQTIVWNEYEKRGFLDKFREELEIEHIYSAFLAGMKMLIYRYEKPDYNIYLLLRELILQRIPDFENNKYVKAGNLGEMYSIMLETLRTQLNKEYFLQLCESIKRIGL